MRVAPFAGGGGREPRVAHWINSGGLVVIIWALAGPALSAVFQQAIERVTGF